MAVTPVAKETSAGAGDELRDVEKVSGRALSRVMNPRSD